MLRLFLFATIATSVLTEPKCSNDVKTLLAEGDTSFTGKFLFEAVKNQPNKSLIMSPFSVFTPIAELALYSKGNTYSQIMDVLNLRDKSDIRCAFSKLNNNLRSQKNVELNLASKIYSTDRYPLSKNFLRDTKNIFDAQAETLNFDEPQNAANTINKWVEQQTNDRIKNIASSDMFEPDTRLVLANALYFMGNWFRQFNKRATISRTFHITSNNTVKIPTMYQQNEFNYGEDSKLDCKVLEMYYRGGNFSFVVFLPNQIDGLYNLVQNLQDENNFYNAYNSIMVAKVNVFLPKMNIQSKFDLTDILQKAGVTDVFDPVKSNLTGILQHYEPLYISTAVQKASLEVGEAGSEATAANIFAIARTMAFIEDPIYNFKADHPFAFYILMNQDIIFSGVFTGN